MAQVIIIFISIVIMQQFRYMGVGLIRVMLLSWNIVLEFLQNHVCSDISFFG